LEQEHLHLYFVHSQIVLLSMNIAFLLPSAQSAY